MLNGLVVSEVALSLVLLVSAGLLIRSFIRLQSIDPGFKPEGVLTARVQTPGVRYPTPVQRARFYTNALARISALPGVEQAAGITFLPMAPGGGIRTGYWRNDRPRPAAGEGTSTHVRPITPGFFKTMGIPMVVGRDFTPADQTESPQVTIISEAAARRIFPRRESDWPAASRCSSEILVRTRSSVSSRTSRSRRSTSMSFR